MSNFTNQDLLILEDQEKLFEMDMFSSLDAIEIGRAIVGLLSDYDRGIVCQIVRESDDNIIFQYICDDKTNGHFKYTAFKHEVLKKYNHSSGWVYVASNVDNSGVASDVRSAAGAFPIKDKQGNLIASILVSGLHHGKDHEIIIRALEIFTGKKAQFLDKEIK